MHLRLGPTRTENTTEFASSSCVRGFNGRYMQFLGVFACWGNNRATVCALSLFMVSHTAIVIFFVVSGIITF